MATTRDSLWLAPIRGVTGDLFRGAFARHFPGFDGALAPFIRPLPDNRLKPSDLRELAPENNQALPVVPQIISNDPRQIISLGRALFDLGYDTLNWNLGCPYPMVAKKKRGSGLLPDPERIDAILSQVVPAIPNRLSLKLRLGRQRPEEIGHLLPIFNRYPLTELIIHPRLGVQMYKGDVDLEGFAECLRCSRHPLTYNGDLNDVQTYRSLKQRFPDVTSWMLGRGALANPFLPGALKGHPVSSPEARRTLLVAFHDDLLAGYAERLSGPGHLLNKMREVWPYLAGAFLNRKRVYRQIRKAATMEEYAAVAASIFGEAPMMGADICA
jgi:tRNA-dihydrouridine synthase